MNVVHRILAQAKAHPDAIAILDPSKRITYGQLAARVAMIAGALTGQGVRPGNTVAVNGSPIDFACGALAVAWVGGILLPLADLPVEVAERLVARDGAVAVLCGDSDAAPISAPSARFVGTIPQLLAKGGVDVPVYEARADEIWWVGFSSGSTGERKRILFSHGSTIAKLQLLAAVPEIQGTRTMVHMGFAVPFAFSYCLRELSQGATVMLGMPPEMAAGALERFGIDLLIASTGNALTLLKGMQETGAKPPATLKTVMLGGGAVTPAQCASLRSGLCDNLWVNYGATEVGLIALLDPRLMDEDPGCAGRIMPWVECQVVDPAPEDGPGMLRYRAPSMASGYLLHDGSSDAERHAFDDGWFRSTDRGTVRDGRLYLAGRADHLVNIGGNKIDPLTVERVIDAIPGVNESAVVAAPNSRGEPVLVAFVAAAAGSIDPMKVRKHCAAALEFWKVPQFVVTLDELPRTAAGKVDRDALRNNLQLRRVPVADARTDGRVH